jgi:hypothetical protein
VKALLAFSALLTSGEASSEGSPEAAAEAELLADADAFTLALARFDARAALDALAFFGELAAAAPAVFFGWPGVVVDWDPVDWDPVDWDPAPACCVLFFFVGDFVAGLVGGLVAGADVRFTGVAPGGSALPPFCQENARKPPLGTLVPPTPDEA